MKVRTTVSINQNYLQAIKVLGAHKDKTLSSLVNEALRAYLSHIKTKQVNKNQKFFNELKQLGLETGLKNEKDLAQLISQGRL